ncbi:MAG: acetolactate synthase small subunit [Oscillospiraceae bacterium]|nr:acetolactate synthase small subunit [Oscillospiraceae bacterium]
MDKNTISILVGNRAGVLSKVVSLFSRRGYNIDSLAVGVTDDVRLSRITIVAESDDRAVAQIVSQLLKLIDVVKVSTLREGEMVSRELCLIKVRAGPDTRSEIIQMVEIFRAKIVDVSAGTLTIEVSGESGKVRAFEDLLRPYGIEEVARTGSIALGRGPSTIKG